MQPADKICSIDDLRRRLDAERAKGKRVVQCHGVFDVMHPGHILHFKEARTFGDVLAVTITPDRFVKKGPGRPVFNERLRMETIAALEYVDYVGLNEWPTAVEAIGRLRPHVYAKGKDYADASADLTRKILDEEAAVKAAGGEIRFTTTELHSSSSLANRFYSVYPQKTQEYLAAFKKRHSSDEIISALEKLADLRVLVVGEAILDQYTYCLPLAKSPKEFIVATRYQSDESFAGGALATANHVAGFCKDVTLVTALGPDEGHEQFIRSKLKPNIDLRVVRTPRRPTIQKRRFLEPNFLTKMFEIQYLEDAPFSEEETGRFIAEVDRALPKHDLLVINDFGHGLLTDPVRRDLCGAGIYTAVNTQTNSANLGFNPITRYERVDYGCLDEPEMRLAAREKFEDIKSIGARLRDQLKARALMGPGAPAAPSSSPARAASSKAPRCP
jgi:rfaE bifunctional protein nucleotidyltransferase chain/domain